MDYAKIIIKIISLIIVAMGVVMIYDARKLSKKWFSFADINNSTKLLKIIGFVISVIGCIVVIVNM